MTFALLTIKLSLKIIYEYLQSEDTIDMTTLMAIKHHNTNKKSANSLVSEPQTGIKAKLPVKENPDFDGNTSKQVDSKQDVLTILRAIDLISIIEDISVAISNLQKDNDLYHIFLGATQKRTVGHVVTQPGRTCTIGLVKMVQLRQQLTKSQ